MYWKNNELDQSMPHMRLNVQTRVEGVLKNTYVELRLLRCDIFPWIEDSPFAKRFAVFTTAYMDLCLMDVQQSLGQVWPTMENWCHLRPIVGWTGWTLP